jgi:hypothetical protein
MLLSHLPLLKMFLNHNKYWLEQITLRGVQMTQKTVAITIQDHKSLWNSRYPEEGVYLCIPNMKQRSFHLHTSTSCSPPSSHTLQILVLSHPAHTTHILAICCSMHTLHLLVPLSSTCRCMFSPLTLATTNLVHLLSTFGCCLHHILSVCSPAAHNCTYSQTQCLYGTTCSVGRPRLIRELKIRQAIVPVQMQCCHLVTDECSY